MTGSFEMLRVEYKVSCVFSVYNLEILFRNILKNVPIHDLLSKIKCFAKINMKLNLFFCTTKVK